MTSANDGKDVKSNQTSGQKSKSFYIELYKSLDGRLSGECGLPERTGHLCEAWRRVHSLCLHSAPATHPHLLSWLQRHTARTILQTEWQSPKSKDEQTSLEQAIDKFITDCETNPSKDGLPRVWETQLQQRGEWFKRILGNPWGHPVLRVLLDPNDTKLDDEQILEWLKEERGVMFVTRLRQLAASKCDDLAMSLLTAVMDRARGSRQEQAEEPKDIPPAPSGPPTFEDILITEAGFTVDVWELLTDIELVLLHKGDRRSKCIELAKQTPLRNGYQLVERLLSRLETSPREKKLWKNAKEVATLVAQVIIARCMVVPTCTNVTRTALYCCTRSLVRLLPAARLPAAAAALAAPAVTARHLHTLAQAVDAQCTVNMKPFVCELYVRAITAGMNELERLKLKTEKEAEARLAEQTLSSWFTQLGTLLALSERVRCECTLTAFSVHPSPAMYERIKAAPQLAPVALDPAYARGESTSEFGSWTTDSRTQSNLVKTSETLNIKQSQNLANVLSTALLTEGEAIGLSPELCQDLAVLLSGPRVKTLSWDMDREALLESCQAYMERTHGGTRALTTELKYLNLDPSSYQHLPEEEDDENDMYYGIEKGYEHLVEVQEPEDVWQDADPERTESASSASMDPDFNTTTKKKKKTRRPASPRISTDEDSDPLSLVSEIKKEKKKERPLSKDRSKERKKKTKSKDNPENKEGSRERRKETDGQEKKKRKPRKKKSDPQVEPKPGSLSSLIGLKIANIKIPDGKFKRNPETKVPLCVTDSDYDSQGKSSLASLNSEGNDPDVLFDGLYNMEEYKSPEKTDPLEVKNPFFNSELSVSNGKVAVNTKAPAKIPQRDDLFDRPTPQFSHTVPNNQARIATSTANVPDLNTQPNTEKNIVREQVKKSITKLIEFRRQKSIMEEAQRRLSTSVGSSSSSPRLIDSPAPIPRSPSAIIRQEFPEPTDTSPKAVTVPDIPKLYIDKKQIEQIRVLKQEVDTLFNPQYTNKPVIQFASTNKPHDYSDAFKQSLLCNEIQNLLNPKNTGTTTPSQGMVNAELNFQDFLRELQESINAGTGSSKVPSTQPMPSKSSIKKELRPISRVTPVVPPNHKPEPGTSSHCAKSTIQTANKVDTQLNTFARLSYMHKNKQNDKQSKHYDSQMEPEALLRKVAEEHKASKLKYLYSKGDVVLSRAGQMPENLSMKDEAKVVIKKVPPTVKTTSASDHPVLLNMLNTYSSHVASANPIPRQDSLTKNILHQEMSRPATPVQVTHRAVIKQAPRQNKLMKSILKQEVTRPIIPAQATRSAVTKVKSKKDNHLRNQISLTQSTALQGAFPRRDNLVKNISHQDILQTLGPKTNLKGSALSEKDQNDLILLLRQQNKLNSPAHYMTTDVDIITSKIHQSTNDVTSHNAILSAPNYNQNDVMHTTVIKNYPTETKSNNIPIYEGYNIKKSSDTGQHIVTKIVDCKSRKIGKSCKKPIPKIATSAQSNNQEIKPSVCNNQISVSKSDILQSPEMKKAQDWASVMDAILKHKTPSRGPNALDMALKKNQNLRNQRIVRTNTVFEDSSAEETGPKHQQTPANQQTPPTKPQTIVSKTVQSNTVIHKGPVQSICANVNPKVIYPQKTLDDVVKNLINAEILKRPVHIQKKPYVSELINQKDPFISGIPNSDYDLLEELMDDELKKEIGELSSDEETYRTSPASTNAIKIVSNSKYPYMINNPPPQQEKDPAVNLRSHLNTVNDARNTIIQPSKTHQTKTHNHSKTVIDTFSQQMPITKQQTVVMDRKIMKVPESMQSCSKNVSPQPSINKTGHQKRNTTKQTYNVSQSVNRSQTHFVDSRNVVITQKVVPKVVLFGSDLVYDALTTSTESQKGVESRTPYIALNATPNKIYQTTKYDGAPVMNEVITRNAMTVPMSAAVIENTKKVSITQKLEVGNTKSTNVAPDNLKDYLENFTDESPTHNVYTEQASILQASAAVDTNTNMNKNCERKILSEVQDKQMIKTEKSDSKITRSIASEDVIKEVNSINPKKGCADVQSQNQPSLKEKHVLKDQGLDVLNNPNKTKTSSEIDPNSDSIKEIDIERLKKKRIDIINRKVNHLSTVSPIPLGYVPLSKPELTYSEKCMTSLHKADDQPITETDNATTHKAINDEQIHGKNEDNNSKTTTGRRILLRSSNDLKVVTVSSNLQDQRNPVGRKTKVRLKVPAQLVDNDNQQEGNAAAGVDPKKKEEKDSPKRISKRILKKQANNKEIKSDRPNAVETVTTDEIKADADTVTVKRPPKKSGNKKQKVIKRHVLNENSEESNVDPTFAETTDTFKVVDTQNLKKVIRRTRKNKLTIKKTNDDAENTDVINPRIDYAGVSKEVDTADKIINNARKNKTVAVTSILNTEVAGSGLIDIEDALQGSKIEKLTVAPVIKEQAELVHRPHTNRKDKKGHIIKSVKARKKSKKVKLQQNVPAEVKSALNNSHTNKTSTETETKRLNVAINLDINKTSSDVVSNHTFAMNNLDKKNTSVEVESAVTPTVINLDEPIISDEKETNKTSSTIESVISENAKQEQPGIRQNHLTNLKEPKEIAFKEDENKSSNERITCPEIKNNDLKEIVLPKSPLSSSCLLNQSQCVSRLPNNLKRNEKTELIKIPDSLETSLNTSSKCETTTSNNAVLIDAPVDKSSKSNESIKQTSNDFDSWKHKIVIEELPITGNSNVKSVRIKLPNGRTFKANVFGELHVGFESLLADPTVKSILISNNYDIKHYTVNIKQISTAPRHDSTNTRIEEVNIKSNNGPIETVSLLSDDEDELVEPVIEKQTFKTEFGEYNISSLDDDVHKKHQSRFQQKCLLKLTDIKKTLQDDKQFGEISKDSNEPTAEAKMALVENVLKKPELDILENNNIDKSCVAKTPILGDEAKVIKTVVVKSDSPSLTPKDETSKDSIPKTIPIMPLDVIEIDDSSNDSTDNILNSETDEATVLINEALLKNEISITTAPQSIIEKQVEVIDELKNLLLKDLGVDLVSSANNQEIDRLNVDSVIDLDDHTEDRGSADNQEKDDLLGSLIDLNEHIEDQSYIQTKDCFVKLYNCDDLVLEYEKNKIINRKCFVQLHRCDDKIVVADWLDSNADEQDGVVPKNSKLSENSFLALDDTGDLSDTSEFGRNSPVMDAFESIASLRRATWHKKEGPTSVMDVYELIASLRKANRTISVHTENPKCHCEWYATKRTLQNSAKAESANTLQAKHGVSRLHESTFDSTVASSPIDLKTDKTIPTLKTLTAKIFQNHEIVNRLRPYTITMEMESIQNLTHRLKRKRNGQGINVASKMLKKMADIEHVYKENTNAIIDVAKARDTKDEYACSQHKNVIAEPNNSLLSEEKVVNEYVHKWLFNVAQQTESVDNKTEYSIQESDKNTNIDQTHESTVISKRSETDFPSDTLSSSDSDSIMLNAKIDESYATHNNQADFSEIPPVDVDNTSVDSKSVTIANVGHMDPESQAICDISNNEKQKAIASESFELSAAEQKNYQNVDNKSETPVLTTNTPLYEPETLLSVINDKNSNNKDLTSDSDCNIAIGDKQSGCDPKKDEILSTTYARTKTNVECTCTMDFVGAGCGNQFKTEKDSDSDVNSEFNQENSSLADAKKSQEINKNQSNLNNDCILQVVVATDVPSNTLCVDVCIANSETRQNKMIEQKESVNDSISIKYELTSSESGTLYKYSNCDCIEPNQTSYINDNILGHTVDLSNTSCKESDLDCVADCSLKQGDTPDQVSDISDSILLDHGHILETIEDALGRSSRTCQDSNLDCIADNKQDLLKTADEHNVDLSDTSCNNNNSENDSQFNQNESTDHASVISNCTYYEPTLAPIEHSVEQSDKSSKDINLDYEQDILRTPDKTNYINDNIVKNVEHNSDTSCKNDNLLTDCQLDQSEATDLGSDISDSILQGIELTVNLGIISNEVSNLNCITDYLKDQRETVTETNNTSNNSLLISSQESNPSETSEAVLESNNNSSNCENQDNTEYECVLPSHNLLAVHKSDDDENDSLKCSVDSIDNPEYENNDSNLSSSLLAAADDLKICISDSLVPESLNDDETQNEDKEIVTVVEVIANDEPTLDCAYKNCEKETKNITSASGCNRLIAAEIESINDGSRINQDSENENENNDTIERVIVLQSDDEATDTFIHSNVAEIKNLECPSEKPNCDDTVENETDCLTELEDNMLLDYRYALQNKSLGRKNTSEEINDISIKSESIKKSPLLMAEIKSKIDREIILNGIEYEDPHVGTCYVFPIAEQTSSSCDDTFDEETEEIIQVIQEINEDGTVDNITLETTEINSEDQYLKFELPKITYSRINNKQGLKYSKRPLKRKIDMSDIRISEKKYRKGKNIDYPKITAAAMIESAYSKEFKRVFDYCSSLKFSYSQPYHKDVIDVEGIVQNWPLSGSYSIRLEDQIDNEDMLFVDLDNIQYNLVDPMEQSLAEEICTEFSELDFSSISIRETNFNMGFGERSDRVIQNLEDVGDDSKFSAATLSDVKQPQPFLLPEDYENYDTEQEEVKTREDQMKQLKRYITYIQMRDKVRSFFKKTTVELKYNWVKEKCSSKSESTSFPFDLCNTMDFMDPPLADVLVQVVQVGQLPVSAAAQNPVTCDPRVTQVSDASPSQCSAENSPQDDSQPTIKTEYTELTTADLSVPMMQEYAQHIQHLPMEPQESTNMPLSDENIPIETEIKSVVKIELMEESEETEESGDTFEYNEPVSQEAKNDNNVEYSFDTNQSNATTTLESEAEYQAIYNSPEKQNVSESVATQPQETKHQNGAPEKTDQIAHAMNAAGITTTSETMTNTTRANALVNMLSQKLRQGSVGAAQSTNSYPKATAINAMALQQALAQILPPPLNQTNGNENNQHATNTQVAQQVLHIVQGKNASGSQITLVDNSQQSVINAPNATPVLHIVQNKSNPAGATSNGSATPQANSFGGLSLVDTGLQQGGNQLLHIVNTGNQKNNNATGQLLKRVNLLTNLANVQGSNEQKMVQFVCKSADGKSIQLNAPHQRSMVLRLQPIETPNLQTAQKSADGQDLSPTSNAANALSAKDAANQQEIKSRSVYEENYAKFIQNSSSKTTAGEKSTSLPKFNQAFGKPTGFQDGSQNQNDMAANNSHLASNTKSESSECQATDNAMNLDHIGQISSPPLLLRKSPAQTSQSQVNLVQQLKQTITPMNIQTMHGGVIYTRQIPVNIGGGQTINLITVPSTDLVDDAQKQQQGGQNEIEPSIIKIVPQNQATPNTEGLSEDGANINVSNEGNQNPQPVLTQMRIKLPMLSKTPQMVSGARVVRPSYFQIQRNVIGGANQPVYQQLVLTAAPPLGQQTIRLPQTQTTRQIKVQDNQSSAESQMSSSTLEQLREFDMVLEQVKERSSVPPSSTSSSFSKLHTASSDTTDGSSASSTSTETSQQVLYSIGNSHQPLNVAYVNRKLSTVTTPTTSTFVRSPDSSGIVDSPTSSTHVQIPHTVTTDAVHNEASTQPKPKSSKSKSRPKASSNPPNNLKLNPVPPKTSAQKPLEDEQTTQRILYILAEYKEQVENSPDKDKPAPRRRSHLTSNPSGSSKRKKSSSGSRRHGNRDMSPIHGEDTCRTMGSEDSSCGTSQGDCNESCLESHSPQDSPRKVVRKLTFEQETPVHQPRPQPQRNVIVADGQTITVARGTAGKPATAVLMPANYILPVSMVKGGQQIAIVTNRGPKLLTVGGGEGGATNALLLQRLIGPAGLKPVLTRPGVRHVRLPTAALQNLQAFNFAAATTVQPPDSTASPAPAPTPPELIDTRATSSPWTDRDCQDVKPERGSSPEGSEPWHLPASRDPHDYIYEETVRADNLNRTVLDPIPDRYSPDMEAQRIFDKMFDVESKKSYMGDSHDDSPRCAYDIDASDCDDKAYHQVVQKKDGSSHRQHRLTHVSAAALRHKYAILEHELRLQKSLSEECEDLGVDSPSASELFPEAELLFATSPAHEHAQDQGHHSHTPQPTLLNQSCIPQPDMDDQIATDQLLTRDIHEDQQDLNMGLEDVGIVTVSEDGMQATIALDQEEFARSHPNTTFHSEPEVGEVQPFTIAGLKGRQITSTIFHSSRAPATVLMSAPHHTVISQPPASNHPPQTLKYSDIDNMINSIPSNGNNINLSSVLVKDPSSLTRFDTILNDSRELHLSNTASAIVHSAGNATQVIRRVCYEDDKRDNRFLMDEPDALIAGDDAKMIAEDSSRDATMESMTGDVDDDRSSPERHAELFWESNSASERSESRRPLDFSSDSEKCCKSPYDETNSTDSSVGTHMRLDSVIKDARGIERSASADGSSDDAHPPLRTYPPQRSHHAHGGGQAGGEGRSLSGKTRAGEGRRRVVKRGCHCCSGSPAPPRPKKSRQRKPTMDFTTN